MSDSGRQIGDAPDPHNAEKMLKRLEGEAPDPVVSDLCRDGLHDWCANRTPEECRCSCACHKKPSKDEYRPPSADFGMTMSLPTTDRREAGGWQPIETAPKDGTVILLMQLYGEYPDGAQIDVGCFGFIETSDLDGMEVYDWSSNYGYIENPTHWMPLPPPPPVRLDTAMEAAGPGSDGDSGPEAAQGGQGA